jgi:hypothetical protein
MPLLLMGPLGKILGLAVLVLALVGFGEWHGRKAVQLRWDATVSVQAVEAAQSVIAAAENTAAIERKFADTLREHDAQVRIVEKEVTVYVQGKSPKCPVSPQLEHTIDTVSRLLDTSTDSLPAAASAPRGVAEPPQADLTDAALLQAYEHAVEELSDLWNTYAALVEWTRSSYAVAREASGQPPLQEIP